MTVTYLNTTPKTPVYHKPPLEKSTATNIFVLIPGNPGLVDFIYRIWTQYVNTSRSSKRYVLVMLDFLTQLKEKFMMFLLKSNINMTF